PRSPRCWSRRRTRSRWRCTARCGGCGRSWRRRPALLSDLTASDALVQLRRPALARIAPGLLAAAVLTPLAAGNGGYFPPAWGWSAAALLWAAAIAVLARDEIEVTAAEAVSVAAFGLLTVWMLVSAAWSGDTTSAVLEAERTLVYVSGLVALLLVSRRGEAIGSLLAGAVVAVTASCAYGLVGRLFPSVHAVGGIADTGRLAEPVGYWNGLGILAAMGAIVALGLTAHARPVGGRIAAACALPVVMVALYFTFSRGAWIALGFGLVCAVVVDRRRWFLLVTAVAQAPWIAIGVAVAATSPALTHAASRVGPTTSEGHELALVLLACTVAAGAAAWGLRFVEARFEPTPAVTRMGHRVTLVAAVILVLAAVARFGSPIAIAGDMYVRFNAPPPGGFNGTAGHVGRNLNLRLFSLSGNARAGLWRVAWHDVRTHPLLGSGAGTYERYYLQHRDTGLKVKNAHNLYLETLADLGPVGLVLLLAGLAAPLAAGLRARREPLVPVAVGGFAAYLLHAGADWDWQMTAITLTALTCAAGLLTSGPRARWRVSITARPVRGGALAAVALLAVLALIGLRGN